MKLLAMLTAACLALAVAAHAQRPISLHARTAGELAELCGANHREPGSDAKINYCHGFVQGVLDVELMKAGDKKPFCFPSPAPSRDATLSQFVDWVRASAAHRSEGPVDGLMQYLAERYPCK